MGNGGGRLRGALALVALLGALALLAGCGSGGSKSNASGTAAKTGATGATGGLKYDTAPKYAKPSSSEPVKSGVVQIAYRNIAIDPDTVRVKVGGTVKWTNYDSVPHNVTSEGGPLKFASKNFGEGQSYEVKMTKPGIVHYESTGSPATMNGTIEVVS